MKKSLRIIVAVAVFTSVIASALTVSMLMLLQSKSAKPLSGTPPNELVSTGPKNSPEIVGTEHPVPANPTPLVTVAPKRKTPNSVKPSTASQAPDLVENDSNHEAESPREIAREKAEQAREQAESMRARVEDLYQEHRISEAAYKKGQAEYQHALAKYEDLMAKYSSAPSRTGTDND